MIYLQKCIFLHTVAQPLKCEKKTIEMQNKKYLINCLSKITSFLCTYVYFPL